MKENRPLKKLLFIHDALPAEGISGMVIFLRHFQRLQGWDIEILIPENSYNQAIVADYPGNFYVTTFPLRRKYWLPFRENSTILANIRLYMLHLLFKKITEEKKPDIIISVLFHYYGVAASSVAKDLKIPFMLFLHDRWDIKTDNPFAQKLRMKAAKKALLHATHILSVTRELTNHYSVDHLKNAHVFFPIPNGFVPMNLAQTLNDPPNKLRFIYAGTVEDHHVRFFNLLAPLFQANNYTLVIVTHSKPLLDHLIHSYPSTIHYKPPFVKNSEILEYIVQENFVVIVNYGLDDEDNKFAAHSFPSKFIEFSGLGLPIIAVAPVTSPFYKFLEEESWPLLFTDNNLDQIEYILKSLEKKDGWMHASSASQAIYQRHFMPDHIQAGFESFLNANNNLTA